MPTLIFRKTCSTLKKNSSTQSNWTVYLMPSMPTSMCWFLKPMHKFNCWICGWPRTIWNWPNKVMKLASQGSLTPCVFRVPKPRIPKPWWKLLTNLNRLIFNWTNCSTTRLILKLTSWMWCWMKVCLKITTTTYWLNCWMIQHCVIHSLISSFLKPNKMRLNWKLCNTTWPLQRKKLHWTEKGVSYLQWLYKVNTTRLLIAAV